MKFPKLCDLCIEHEYYNAGTSERLKMQLIPSVESVRLIKNKHIVIHNHKNVFSIYGDVFSPETSDGGQKFKSEFKLSFALTVSDPYFFDASNLKRPEKEDSGSKETTLKQGNTKTVYYFHNNRNGLVDSKAYLSTGKEVGEDDIVCLNPLTFTREGLKELLDLSLSPNIVYGEGDQLDDTYSFSTMVDPANPNDINRIFKADLSAFGGGVYTFTYSYKTPNRAHLGSCPTYEAAFHTKLRYR